MTFVCWFYRLRELKWSRPKKPQTNVCMYVILYFQLFFLHDNRYRKYIHSSSQTFSTEICLFFHLRDSFIRMYIRIAWLCVKFFISVCTFLFTDSVGKFWISGGNALVKFLVFAWERKNELVAAYDIMSRHQDLTRW